LVLLQVKNMFQGFKIFYVKIVFLKIYYSKNLVIQNNFNFRLTSLGVDMHKNIFYYQCMTYIELRAMMLSLICNCIILCSC
jgi:hypothetical protein